MIPLHLIREQPELRGVRPCKATPYRWRDRGVYGHRLRCHRVGGRWYTTAADLDAFITKLNGHRAVEAVAK